MSVLVAATSCSEEKPDPAAIIDGGTPGGGRPSATETIGVAGGTVETSTGAGVIVSHNALEEETTLTVTELDSTPAELNTEQAQDAGQPATIEPMGHIHEFTPHGQTFANPVTVRLPYSSFTPARLESQVRIYWAESLEGPWRALETSVVDSATKTVSAQVSSFSYGVPAVHPTGA
jgi:hypothetical protein